MNCFSVRNADEALAVVMQAMLEKGVRDYSRGKYVRRLEGVSVIEYSHPTERVLLQSKGRNANPFFHLMDAMYLLSGSNSTRLLARFLPSIVRFSDNGSTFHGAYGRRLRGARGMGTEIDQIQGIIELLKTKPDTRQAVMSIWDPLLDLNANTVDTPCNIAVVFEVASSKLNITVYNRSNDAIWGACGANVVQFSYLQEFVAASLCIDVGKYTQVTNNLHVYEDNKYWHYVQKDGVRLINSFQSPEPSYRITHADTMAIYSDLCKLAKHDGEYLGTVVLKSVFGELVLSPAIQSYEAYKKGEIETAINVLNRMSDKAWALAMRNWVSHMHVAKITKQLTI